MSRVGLSRLGYGTVFLIYVHSAFNFLMAFCERAGLNLELRSYLFPSVCMNFFTKICICSCERMLLLL